MAALRAVKILPHVKEIRIHLCQKSDASKGVRYVKMVSEIFCTQFDLRWFNMRGRCDFHCDRECE